MWGQLCAELFFDVGTIGYGWPKNKLNYPIDNWLSMQYAIDR
ncbi:hypothetical protein [Caudoviricetes sp.]|nr:hypothetical protein [Caudoviricetes sp.]UOF81022.1 hypothetical protein [Caudoviricetes sp.]UOF81418.1 hypothetical protein [Caudoviricetes sp.]